MEERRRETHDGAYDLALDPVNADEIPPDYNQLLSLLFGIGSTMMRQKLLAWLALIACLRSLSLMKFSQSDTKQVFMSLLFAGMSLLINYFGPASKS